MAILNSILQSFNLHEEFFPHGCFKQVDDLRELSLSLSIIISALSTSLKSTKWHVCELVFRLNGIRLFELLCDLVIMRNGIRRNDFRRNDAHRKLGRSTDAHASVSVSVALSSSRSCEDMLAKNVKKRSKIPAKAVLPCGCMTDWLSAKFRLSIAVTVMHVQNLHL